MAKQNEDILSHPEKGYTALDPSLDALKKTLDPHNYKKTEFIAGMFPVGCVSILAGAPGVGKSMLVQKLICDLSLGGEILDGLFSSQRPVKSLVFNGELPMNVVNERSSDIRLNYRIENIIYVDAIEALKHSITLDLNTDIGKGNINSMIVSVKPDLVVFDSLMSFNLGDENTQHSMQPLFSELLRLADQHKIAILVVHHVRKKSSKELGHKDNIYLDDVIGSSILIRNSANVIGVHKRKLEDGQIWSYVQTLKSWFSPITPFAFRPVTDDDCKNFEGIAFNDAPKFETQNKKEKIFRVINDLLTEKGSFTRAEVESRSPASRTLILDCIGKLLKGKKLKAIGDGKDKFYKPPGRC